MLLNQVMNGVFKSSWHQLLFQVYRNEHPLGIITSLESSHENLLISSYSLDIYL
jgi:hypothetical protein